MSGRRVFVDGRDLGTFSDAEKADLIIEILQDNAALAALQKSTSHGFVHLRSFVDPQTPRKPVGPEPL